MVAAPMIVGSLTEWRGFGMGAAAVAVVLVSCAAVGGLVLGPRRRRPIRRPA
jgi:hypothetical protein